MAEAAVLAGLGWLASPVISKLVNDSISYVGSDIAKGLEELETTVLPRIQLTIEAAQHSTPNKKALLAKWLARLKNAYFDAEAILHELEYKRLKRKVKREDKKLSVRLSSKPVIKSLAKFIGPVARMASRLSSPQKREMLQRMKKLKEIAAEAKDFRDLLGIQNTKSIQNVDNSRVTSSRRTDKVFGRDRARDKIIKFLLDGQGGSSSRTSHSVVAVTGMGGAGKTTLAQYVYNDETVKKHFSVRMWLSLSRNFDIKEATKEMIECASRNRPNLSSLEALQDELIKILPESGNIMVVLDDVWYDQNDRTVEENEQWDNLLAPFASQGGTCKIVVTCRSSRSFPNALQPGKLIQLSDLASHDFRSLIRYFAIDGLQISDQQLKDDLSDIVDQIAKKMSKLPLAAKVVGNQLSKRPNIKFWRDTLEDVDLSDIMKILLWSFHRFDPQVQRCFLFCSIFPKGTKHNAYTLVPYWVALDFIQPSSNNINVEAIGSEYFKKLVADSIFQRVDKWYVMHDLFHDLAEKHSAEDCFMITNVEREIPLTVQHVHLEVNNKNMKENLSRICNLRNLRTLILGKSFIDDISEIISKISTNCRNLRILHVYSRGYKTFPRVVGNLKNLRLIYCRMSSIEELPDSVSQLYHLQYLQLPLSVKSLPVKLSNLIKLRRIEMFNSDGLLVNTLPPIPYLGKLTSLQRLDEFHVRKEKGYELQQLRCLEQIDYFLRIVNLENVSHKNEAVEARLIGKLKLKRLYLVWAESAEINGSEIEIIEALQPPPNLKLLTIDGYRGLSYPTWLQEGSFIKYIKEVKFYNCNALTNIPPNFHQFYHCSELVLQNLCALRELSIFPENLVKLSIIKCPCLIFVCENELQVNENQSQIESRFLNENQRNIEKYWRHSLIGCNDILDHELKSFEQTGSKENCTDQLQIIEIAARGNPLEFSMDVNRARWCCHQQRMNFIFRCNTQALKLPSKLRILYLGYCCVSDGALSDCLRGMVTLEELHLSGIMTITTLPPAQVLKSLKRLRVLEIKHCWYLRSLSGLHALPRLESFRVDGCWCLDMESDYAPLPPTLQSFTIVACPVPRAIFNGDLPCLQVVQFFNCLVPSSLSFSQLTKLKTLAVLYCLDLRIIQGLESSSFLNTLELIQLPNLNVKSVLKTWQRYQTLYISSSKMLNKLLSYQDFVPPQSLGIKYCLEEEISFEKSVHLQSIKELIFFKCETKNLPNTLSDFSTLEKIFFLDCLHIPRLPELPNSVQRIVIRNCPLLECNVRGLNDSRITIYRRRNRGSTDADADADANSEEGSPKEKEKLPHRIRPKTRKVEPALLEMPENEINSILILLVKAKEKKWNKEAASRNSNGDASSMPRRREQEEFKFLFILKGMKKKPSSMSPPPEET